MRWSRHWQRFERPSANPGEMRAESQSRSQPVPTPIYNPVPVSTLGYIQEWGLQLPRELNKIWGSAKEGMSGLVQATQAWLVSEVAWLLESGCWVRSLVS